MDAKSLQSCPTLQHHRRQPTRLPHPWDSPGKNPEVGCHFLLQWLPVKTESEVAQLCLTLSDSMVGSPPGSSIHGIFQARVLEWGAIAFSKRSLELHQKTHSEPVVQIYPLKLHLLNSYSAPVFVDELLNFEAASGALLDL